MKNSVELHGKPVQVRLTKAAEKALSERQSPLLVEMELYFSCLIRMKVRFYEQCYGEGALVNEKLQLRFRPVMTEKCDNNYIGDEPPLTDFPIQKPAAFTPNWISLDYRHGQWCGEFGY